jgi:predicted DCC family thiol-disulfide oxidoreductase YuxK
MQTDRDPAGGPIVLFDGICNLCHGTVRFIIARDPGARMRFSSLQSPTGARIAASHGVTPGALESMLLVENGVLYRKSTAALRIARLLRFPWWLGYGLIVVPRFLRDAVYDFVGRHRYRWFGTREYCLVSRPGYERRFIE